MADIAITVSEPHPCWISIKIDNMAATIRHEDFLELEQAIKRAKRDLLDKLDRRDWYLIDPDLA